MIQHICENLLFNLTKVFRRRGSITTSREAAEGQNHPNASEPSKCIHVACNPEEAVSRFSEDFIPTMPPHKFTRLERN